jgi:hypothetical protein
VFLVLLICQIIFGLDEHGNLDNNPRKFHLWVTGSSYQYTITYDPRETDIWMFKSGGGGTVPASYYPAIIPPALTNRWAR